jgi:hypothetical protein
VEDAGRARHARSSSTSRASTTAVGATAPSACVRATGRAQGMKRRPVQRPHAVWPLHRVL